MFNILTYRHTCNGSNYTIDNFNKIKLPALTLQSIDTQYSPSGLSQFSLQNPFFVLMIQALSNSNKQSLSCTLTFTHK